LESSLGASHLKDLAIVKLGGSLITVKDKPFTLRGDVLERIGSELSGLEEFLILVHGGGSYAHPVAKKYSVSEGYRDEEHLKGFMETSIAVRRLNLEVVERLVAGGLRCIGIPSSTIFSTSSGKILTCSLEPIFLSHRVKLAPVTCGDVVFDRELGFTVLSGDVIASYLAIRLKAKRLIYAIDLDGIYVRDRITGEVKVAEELKPGMKLEPLGKIEEDVTGGIVRKLEEGFRAAEKGVEVMIINGLVKDRMRDAVLGKRVLGTVLKV